MKRTNISKEDTKRTSTKFENNYKEGLLGKVELMKSFKFVVFQVHYPNMDNSHLYIILLVLFFFFLQLHSTFSPKELKILERKYTYT